MQQHVMVPEPQHAIPQLPEPGRTFGIVGNRITVLPTIYFDNQFRLRANEIRDEAGNRNLPPKPEAIQLAAAQHAP
jgi:hypothetical protein